MASIQIDGSWKELEHYDFDDDGVLVSCLVQNYNGKKTYLTLHQETDSVSGFLTTVASTAAGAAGGATIADKATKGDDGAAFLGGVFGAAAGFLTALFTAKETGYYDKDTGKLVIHGIIKRTYNSFRTT